MLNFKISRESAEAELKRFLDYYEIDGGDFNEEQLKAHEQSKERIIKAIRLGRLEVGEDGFTLIQTLRDPVGESSTITYGELRGKAKVSMKSKSDTDYYGRCYAVLGALSGLGDTAIINLRGVDLSLAECIGSIFLQV